MDKKNIKNLLEEVIVADFEKLKTIGIGTKEHASAVEDLTKLYRLTIDESKAEQEIRIKKSENKNALARQNKELELKTQELELKNRELELKGEQHTLAVTTQYDTNDKDKADLKERKIDRYVKIGIAVAELILPLAFYGCWMRRGLKFEETGTFTSTTFRGLFGHFRPTKK